ncbi:MAG: 3-keto-5-aminohexanoate cleavage protein [Chloroflexi bacterium]|nr:3-keto-5-aminohexanoate cleavage protein [Chloroflexota bacterium]
MSQKIIISAALTGVVTTRKQSPYIPYTPVEIAAEAKRSADAGASIVHIHARNDDGTAAWDVDTFTRIHEEVRGRCPDIIINYSTGAFGIPREHRIHHVRALKPGMAALNMGSMNYAIYSRKNKRFYHDYVFANPFDDIQFFLQAMNEAGTRPEMECFDTGHINNAQPLIDLGILKPPYQFSLIMGVLGGIPASTKNLVHQADQLPPQSHWQVIGIGRYQWPLVAAAITMGGNVRVGLEDNLYLPDGELAKSNGECVTQAAELIRMIGGGVASISEARELLQLPRDA